jgi:hypothetical protein
MIPVLIPMCKNTELNKKVEKSILSQSILVNIIKCYYEGTKKRQRCYDEERLINEPIVRNICKEEAIKLDKKYVIIQDDDILQLNYDNFKVMREFLINNLDYGAISISGRTKDHNNSDKHIKIGCVMYKIECLKKISFIESSIKQCMCIDVTKSIRDQNYKFNYLDDKIRFMEIN